MSLEVLVVGAGPCGLTLACELLRRGVAIRIVDQLSHTTDQSRALGLHARTLELFDAMGVLDTMLDHGLPIDTIQIYCCGKPLRKISFSPIGTATPFILVLPQSKTEEILSEKLEALGGKVERPVIISHVAQSKASLAFLDGRQEEISPHWIVGCDGAHSTVRRCLNAPFQGAKFPENFGLADVILETSFEHRQAHGFIGNHALFALFPLPRKDHFRIVAALPRGFNEKALSPAYLQQLARERTGKTLTVKQLLWTSIFSIQRRIVPQLRYGSIFLCGDAAHIHSPIGGQGLNISVQDAYNLAWKLALVIQGKAAPKLLDTYQTERYPIARKTLKETTRGTFLLNYAPTWFIAAFLKIVPLRPLVQGMSELSYRYPYHSWKDLFWRGPKPGARAPIVPAEDLRFSLLVFGAPNFRPALPEELFSIHHIGLGDPMALAYHVRGPALYLIRPDRVVGFRMRHPAEVPLRSYLRQAHLLV